MNTLGSSVEMYPDATQFVDADLLPESFNRDPAAPFVELAAKGEVVTGKNGLFEGVSIPLAQIGNFDGQTFLALSFNSARDVLKSDDFSAELSHRDYRKAYGKILLTLDGEEHKRLRKLVTPSFTHRAVNEELVDIVEPIAVEYLEAIADKGEAELISDFIDFFPYRVIAKLFGVRDEIKDDLARETLAGIIQLATGVESESSFATLHGLYQEVIDRHRRESLDDLTQMLMDTEVDGDRLNDTEIREFLIQIVGAGLDTTSRGFSALLRLLLEHPDQFELLKNSPDLLDTAIWEALRLGGPVGYITRVAQRDTSVCGVAIPAGSLVLPIVLSANRDPSRWENPLAFDITRKKQPFVSFGLGAHACIGQSLALAEMKVCYQTVMRMLPNLRKDERRWHCVRVRGCQGRATTQLPVRWDV